MPLAICGVHEVPAFATTPLDHIISIREAHQPAPDIRGFKTDFTLHSFVFADTGNAANALAPREEHMRRLLAIYATTRPESTLLFHCFAGVSRSSAAAFIWLAHHGMSYDEAFKLVVAVRGPFVSPNQLMVGLADKVMGRNGEMEAFVTSELGRRAEERAAWFEGHK
jgi:predicted protein tyrosine phosphatase